MLPISFEFFPAQNEEGQTNLTRVQHELAISSPTFYSITYGAGGTLQHRTLSSVKQATQTFPHITITPHITCINSTRAQLRELLEHYRALGIKRLVVLRGDMPQEQVTHQDFQHAVDLVSFIRQETGDTFHISVAAYPEKHPEADTLTRDIDYFIEKVRAGADTAITQFFYNAEAYFYFRDACAAKQIDIPIIAGILPILNIKQLQGFAERCGAEIPRWLWLAMTEADAPSAREIGVEYIARLCQRLIEHGSTPALHFYTLNRASLSKDILQALAAS